MARKREWRWTDNFAVSLRKQNYLSPGPWAQSPNTRSEESGTTVASSNQKQQEQYSIDLQILATDWTWKRFLAKGRYFFKVVQVYLLMVAGTLTLEARSLCISLINI